MTEAAKKQKSTVPDTSVDKRVSEIQRRRYLTAKGLPTSGGPYQLDLAFPEIIGERNDLRHMPNDYGRCSLFTSRGRRMPRAMLMHEKLFHYNEHISILYTGSELRAEDDELVWLQLLGYGQSVVLGAYFEFSIKDLVRDVGWSKKGQSYDRARKCISRLRATEILALNSKAYGTSGVISLVHDYSAANDGEGQPTQYRMQLSPGLMVLFAGSTFTSHRWEVYRELSPVARRLADYIESHKAPYALSLAKFKKMCGSSDGSMTSFRQTVRRACAEVVEAGITYMAVLSTRDDICFAEHQLPQKQI